VATAVVAPGVGKELWRMFGKSSRIPSMGSIEAQLQNGVKKTPSLHDLEGYFEIHAK
jgi:hypothetical protein